MTDLAATDDTLAEMGACAYRLGMAFGRAAEAAADDRRRVEVYQLFERCFFSVRVATALGLRLRREGAQGARPRLEAERPETENLAEPEPLETEVRETDGPNESQDWDTRAPRERLDADREREAERATLPSLIETLRSVAADAAALPGPQPAQLAAELPALDELLARLATPKGPAPLKPQAARPGPSGLRARLAGGAGTAVAVLARPPDHPRRPPLFPRPPTGPPSR